MIFNFSLSLPIWILIIYISATFITGIIINIVGRFIYRGCGSDFKNPFVAGYQMILIPIYFILTFLAWIISLLMFGHKSYQSYWEE